jgi:hypothetical protein
VVSAPAVTVLVPTFNRAPALRIALESLRRQRFTGWEAIVVGDGCTDGSGEMVAALGDPRIRWHNRPENGGSQTFAFNDGLALARAPWIACLPHDDLWMPWHLQQMLEVATDSGADFIHALCLSFTPDGLARCWGPPPEGQGYERTPFPACSWMHRAEVATRIDGWSDPATIDTATDIDFLRRAARAGTTFAFAPRLSALVFAASVFGDVYRNSRPPLNAGIAALMALDAEWLERELLQETAALLARTQGAAAAPRIAAELERGGTPESVAAYQETRRANHAFRGLDDLPVPDPPPVIRRIAPEIVRLRTRSARQGGTVPLRVDADGLTGEPMVLLDGVPLATRRRRPGELKAEIPRELLTSAGKVFVQVISGGGVSAPVSLMVRRP